MKSLLIASGLILTSISPAVMAHDEHSCNVHFDKDLSISSQQISMKEGSTELWRINSDGQLWLDGNSVTINRDTAALLRDYQAGIRSQTLETVALVEDALALAADAVNSVLTELTGDSLQQHPALQTVLDNIKTRTESIIVRTGDHIDIYGSRFDNLDEAFGTELEQAIEQAVTNSMGSILMLVGKAMSSGEGNVEQRMEAFGERMERFGADLEAQMDIKARALEQRGDTMCANLQALDALENQIQQAIPQMQQYDLIDVSSNSTAFYLYN